MGMTILEGSTFCICDEIGDLDGRTSGFFAEDTRFLSRLELRVNGARPLLLSSGTIEYFSAAFYLRNPVADGLAQDSLSIARERFVGEGMQDHLVVRNETRGAAPLRARARRRHRLRGHHLGQGARLRARRPAARAAAPAAGGRPRRRRQPARARGAGAGSAKTQVLLSRPGEIDGSRVRFELELGPRERWDLRVDVVASLSGEESLPLAVERRFGEGRDARAGLARRLAPAGATAPHLARRPRRARSRSRSPTWPRCGCGRTTASGCSRPPGCRGS